MKWWQWEEKWILWEGYKNGNPVKLSHLWISTRKTVIIVRWGKVLREEVDRRIRKQS